MTASSQRRYSFNSSPLMAVERFYYLRSRTISTWAITSTPFCSPASCIARSSGRSDREVKSLANRTSNWAMNIPFRSASVLSRVSADGLYIAVLRDLLCLLDLFAGMAGVKWCEAQQRITNECGQQ